MPHLLTWKNSKTWPVPSGPITGPEETPAGDLEALRREGTIPERIGEKGTCVGPCRERWP